MKKREVVTMAQEHELNPRMQRIKRIWQSMKQGNYSLETAKHDRSRNLSLRRWFVDNRG